MRRTTLLIAAPLSAIALAATASGCSTLGGTSATAAQASGTTNLVLYSGQHEQTTQSHPQAQRTVAEGNGEKRTDGRRESEH